MLKEETRDGGAKPGLHARNRFREGYDFPALVACCPSLKAFVRPNGFGKASIDFSDPAAVKALNGALLKWAYGLDKWDLPEGCLCPPVPGRSDYVHHLADLLAEGAEVPRGASVRVLDVGTGANGIFPLIGASEYGWRFVGSELDRVALKWVLAMVARHPQVADLIECRWQKDARFCFRGVMDEGEAFSATMCNPPFHGSAAEAAVGTDRKRRNLKLRGGERLNFGGQSNELWCEGGELGFVRRMILESVEVVDRVGWFTSLISKGEHVRPLKRVIERVKAAEVRVIEMAQGQKRSRILAWRFG